VTQIARLVKGRCPPARQSSRSVKGAGALIPANGAVYPHAKQMKNVGPDMWLKLDHIFQKHGAARSPQGFQ